MNDTDIRPVYVKLIDEIYMRILTSEYPPGSKIPTVRDLALNLRANPNTVQRALGYIEDQGLIYTQRTTGKFVTEDPSVIEKARRELAKEYKTEYFDKMKRIGFEKEEAVSFIEEKED